MNNLNFKAAPVAETAIAQRCLQGAEQGSMTFPDIVQTLIQAGFDGYAIDLRRHAATYYLPDGRAIDLPSAAPAKPVAERFDPAVVQEGIREAVALVPGYSYKGFCAKVAAAGCAGYLVSFPGKRVLYWGRDGGTHTELFPGT